MDATRKRIVIISLFMGVLFILLIARLFWLQISSHTSYEERAIFQQTVAGTIQANRGEILAHEQQGLFPIATTKRGWLISIDPRLIKNPDYVYNQLVASGLDNLNYGEFLSKAGKANDPYEIVARRVSNNIKSELEHKGLEGVHFALETWRYYPAGNFASHSLGFVNTDGYGQYGLEHFYDENLFGNDGVFVGEKSLGGQLVFLGKRILEPENNGVNIILSLDVGTQTFLEDVVSEVYEKYDARSAGGIIVEPSSGKILAITAYPSFDPNNYFKEESLSVFRNPLIENVYEMGSVIKPLTMAAAIDAGVVNTESSYFDAGKRIIDGQIIENYDGKGRGHVLIREILSQSLNTGAVFLMEQLGKESFRDYMYRYGFGEKTGIDLPGEATGNLENLSSSRLIEYATASFGQGISMTPISLTRALTSLANGGILTNPYLVEELRYDNGSSVLRKKHEPKRILKQETAEIITRMLVSVVDKELAGGHGKIPGYSVAAKTGTAQIASENSRGYSDDFLHTFFGYGPAYEPEFLIFLYLERPRGVRYASETLTEPFRAIMRYLFNYYEIPPDRPQDLEE